MARRYMIAAAQLGPIPRGTSRAAVVDRMIALLRKAKAAGCRLAVFPEMALTPFFPRWHIDDKAELDSYFEREMPSAETLPLFKEAARLGVGFHLGYCEEAVMGERIRRFNTAILVDESGEIVGKYRKVHLPGNARFDPALKQQHLEPYYFAPGNLGFPVFEAFGGRLGMIICYDRRFPEPYRELALQGVELVCLGYNTPCALPDEPSLEGLRSLHHLLPMQAGAFQNGTWVVASAKAGCEDGHDMMGESCVIAPTGEVVAKSTTVGDELLPYCIDLDMTAVSKRFFNFDTYRRPDCYPLIGSRRAAGPPLRVNGD